MAKNKKDAMTENDEVIELEEELAQSPSINVLEVLMPSIKVLGNLTAELHETYLGLVNKPQTLQSAKNASKTLLGLSETYGKVLIAALEYSCGNIDADSLDDELDFEDEDKSDVDLIDD